MKLCKLENKIYSVGQQAEDPGEQMVQSQFEGSLAQGG